MRGVTRTTGVLGAPALAAALALGSLAALGAPARAAEPDDATLHLVTLERPGTATASRVLPRAFGALDLLLEQDDVLARVGAGDPVYRWTTALDGVAVRLTDAQAVALASDPRVATVEEDAVRRLTAAPAADASPAAALEPALAPAGRVVRGHGGRGVVVGVVDSGLDADDPLFASTPGLGPRPDYAGTCSADDDWGPAACTGKVIGGSWFAQGFGEDRLRTGSSLSPADDDGHGTAMASVIAGNAGISVRLPNARPARYAGYAPLARLAAYKACWTAPDPADDGCSTADLVSAVDAAVADGVDVLSVAVGGPGDRLDALDRALLGATERGVVVVASAGNGGSADFAAHPVPWALTVGASSGVVGRGEVRLGSGAVLRGVMTATRGTGPARVVAGASVPAPGSSSAEAGRCVPGSLDAARVRGRIVACVRGATGRVDMSAAVARAGGVGLVLVNATTRQPLEVDVHSVPTVHVPAAEGRALLRRLAQGRLTATLRPTGAARTPTRVLPISAAGDPSSPVLKPDLVAPGSGVLGAGPGEGASRWTYLGGTSAATAATAGTAAALLGRGLSPEVVRSALVTSARPARDASAVQQGAGVLDPDRAARPGLAVIAPASSYRRWLDGEQRTLNSPTISLQGDARIARRTVTNVSGRSLYFSSSSGGFERHRVLVTPAALRLAPGESATVTLRLLSGSGSDDGWMLWRGATGTETRLPVTVGR